MQLPRIRLTVQRTMRLVIYAAILLAWGNNLGRLSKKYLALARFHENKVTEYGLMANPKTPEEADRCASLFSYHLPLVEKYELVGRWPFIPAWPDPPEPKFSR
jgi:hypothetical protein